MVLPVLKDAIRDPETGVSADIAREVGMNSVKVPESFVSIRGH